MFVSELRCVKTCLNGAKFNDAPAIILIKSHKISRVFYMLNLMQTYNSSFNILEQATVT